jgi:hypothetical protein
MLVRRSDMAALIRRRGDLTPETQHSQEEESYPVWAFAQLRRLGVSLVTVSHADLVGLIRIPRPSSHLSKATGERLLQHSVWPCPALAPNAGTVSWCRCPRVPGLPKPSRGDQDGLEVHDKRAALRVDGRADGFEEAISNR